MRLVRRVALDHLHVRPQACCACEQPRQRFPFALHAAPEGLNVRSLHSSEQSHVAACLLHSR